MDRRKFNQLKDMYDPHIHSHQITHTTSPPPRAKREKRKSRRQRRAEARANLKSAKVNPQRKAG